VLDHTAFGCRRRVYWRHHCCDFGMSSQHMNLVESISWNPQSGKIVRAEPWLATSKQGNNCHHWQLEWSHVAHFNSTFSKNGVHCHQHGTILAPNLFSSM
jgi:hypothetical protein